MVFFGKKVQKSQKDGLRSNPMEATMNLDGLYTYLKDIGYNEELISFIREKIETGNISPKVRDIIASRYWEK